MYPEALDGDISFTIQFAPAKDVVVGGDKTKIDYTLTNVSLEYELLESSGLAEVVSSSLASSDLLYRGVHTQNGSFDNKTTTSLTFKVNTSTENMNAVLILFRTPYEAGALDSEAFFNPGLTLLQDPGEGPRVPVPKRNRMHVLHVGGRAPILYLRARREHQTGGVLQRQILHLGRPARNRLRGRLIKDTSGVQIEVRRNHFFFAPAS